MKSSKFREYQSGRADPLRAELEADARRQEEERRRQLIADGWMCAWCQAPRNPAGAAVCLICGMPPLE